MELLLIDTLRSGNAWKVRLMAGLLGRPLARRTLSIDRGDLASPAFRALAPLGCVPLLRLPDGSHLAESMAILAWLAAGTPWWPSDVPAQAQVLTWLSFEQDRHMKPLSLLRLHLALRRDRDAVSAECRALADQAHAALAVLDARLQAQSGQHGTVAWVASATHPSIADVALYPYTRMAPMGGITLDRYPRVVDWLSRIEALPGHQSLFPGQPDRNLSTEERA
jgi:glutathione S-transferase